MAQVENKGSIGDKLQSLPKWVLYLIMFVVCTVPLFLKGITVPNVPEDSTMDLYAVLMSLPEDKPVLIASDWTNSTRGESGGQFEALLKILMRRNLKFVIYTSADPQAPQVSRDEITILNQERKEAQLKPYESWNDYLVLGYFPNAEATANALGADVRSVFGSRKSVPPGGSPTNVFQSPVLKGVDSINDFSLLVVVTASKTSNITIERLYGKIPLAMMVTGVMGPETHVYYASGQVIGLSKGLKGVYDLETMMEHGLNSPSFDGGVVKSAARRNESYPGFPGMANKGKGTLYYPTLHFALSLLILAVIVGNVGMFLAKRRSA